MTYSLLFVLVRSRCATSRRYRVPFQNFLMPPSPRRPHVETLHDYVVPIRHWCKRSLAYAQSLYTYAYSFNVWGRFQSKRALSTFGSPGAYRLALCAGSCGCVLSPSILLRGVRASARSSMRTGMSEDVRYPLRSTAARSFRQRLSLSRPQNMYWLGTMPQPYILAHLVLRDLVVVIPNPLLQASAAGFALSCAALQGFAAARGCALHKL